MIGWHKGETEGDLSFPAPGRRLRLGIVGGGRGAFIGPIHANGARLSNRWEIVAGALSSNPEVARQAGKDWFLPEDRTYADFRTMAASEAARADGIDAVAITTPNATHHPIARAFMEHGIDVISDKPLTTTLADALDLVALQRQTGLVFGVTYSFAGPRHGAAGPADGRGRVARPNPASPRRILPGLGDRPRQTPGGWTRPRPARPSPPATSAPTPITSPVS